MVVPPVPSPPSPVVPPDPAEPPVPSLLRPLLEALGFPPQAEANVAARTAVAMAVQRNVGRECVVMCLPEKSVSGAIFLLS